MISFSGGERLAKHDVRDRPIGAYRNSLVLEIGELLYIGASDQHMQRFVEPPHDRLKRHSLHAGAQDDSRDGRIVQLAREQRGDVERRAHHDLARVKSFFLVETLALGNFRRELVKTHGGNPDIDDFGVRVERGGGQRKGENRGQEYRLHFFGSSLMFSHFRAFTSPVVINVHDTLLTN